MRLELHFDAGDYRSYGAAVRTADGAEVGRVDRLRLEDTSSGRAVVVRLPARRFDSGE